MAKKSKTQRAKASAARAARKAQALEAESAAVEAKDPVPDPKAPAVQHLGGWFIDLGHPDDEGAK